jgi:hypothetical protein
MALDHFVPDGGIARFSVQAFINGCMNDSESDGYETLSGACDAAKELAETYFGEHDEETGSGTKSVPDVVITGPDGTEYVTRWLVYRVHEGEVSTAQHLVTVENYELEEDKHGRFQVIVPIMHQVTVRVDAEDRGLAADMALDIVKAMDTETLFERCGFGKTVEVDGDGAEFGDPIVSEPMAYDYRGIAVDVNDDGSFVAHLDQPVVTNGLDEAYDAIDRHHAEPDDDPYCVCGVARSEHNLCGCPEGFQTQASWDAERQRIHDEVAAEQDFNPHHRDD